MSQLAVSQLHLSRRRFLQLSAVAAAGMTTAGTLAACAPATAPSATDSGAAPAADTAAAPSENLLRAAFGSQRDDLSVFHGVGRVNADTNRRIFSSLTQFDADLNLVGDLAENWTLSEDRLTYTFNLRQGVQWHDGAPFTSQDVAFTVLSHTHPAVAGFYANAFDKVVGIEEYRNEASDTIAGMTTPDDHTIVFELTQPFSVFPSNLATIWIFPHHLLGEVAPADLRLDPFWSTLPIGTGPYKLVNYVPKQTLEYVRHESYHFGTPKIERMIWTQIPEAATQLLALESGEIDYCQMSLTRDDYDRVNENPDLYIMEAYEPRLPQMAMHYRNFGDIRVRQAICAAIDRNALLAAAGGEGYATILEYYFMNPWTSEGAIKWSDVHTYDPEKAKTLLAEAGWDSSRPIELQTNNPNAQVAILQEQLQAVGINAEIFQVESTSPSLYEEGEYELIIHGLAYSDPFTPANNFTCATAKPNGSSLTQYCNSAYDTLMEQEAQAATQEERAEVYRQLQEILVNDAASVLTIYQPNRGVFNKKVQAEKWAWYAFDHSWEWSIV